ncbi:MAG: hypothetical protein AAGA03_02455 [Planctomycetota bacterium]
MPLPSPSAESPQCHASPCIGSTRTCGRLFWRYWINRTPIILFAALIVLTPHWTAAEMVTLIPLPGEPTGANINALAGPLFSSDLTTATIDDSGTDSASASLAGNSVLHEAVTELDFSTEPAFFSSSFSGAFTRTATLDHRASAESVYHFSVDVPTIYEAMGFFSVTDEVGTTTPGNVELEMELLEFDAFGPMAPPPATLYYTYQKSSSTIDQGFLAGEMDGDETNILEGSATGILDPSKLYRFRTLVTINAVDLDGSGPLAATDGGASARGAHTLLFAPAVAVPEPSAFAAIALLSLVPVARRRRRL